MRVAGLRRSCGEHVRREDRLELMVMNLNDQLKEAKVATETALRARQSEIDAECARADEAVQRATGLAVLVAGACQGMCRERALGWAHAQRRR